MRSSLLLLLGTLASATVASALLTAAVRQYAVRRAILDIPNGRSSHSVPTPRGGGLAIVAVIAGGVAALTATGSMAPALAAALAAGLPVAVVGWVDDRRGVAAQTRLLVQTASAAAAVLALGGLPALRAGAAGTVPLGITGGVLAVVAVVWMTNLYNFMDGIDGLAGGEAVTVGLAGGGLAWAFGAPHIAAPAWLVAAAAAGFLGWNWAPARIFMGDVGSGFLGFVFAVLALGSERSNGPAGALWIVLLGTFVFDATVTLGRRAWYGESVTTPHRAHAYQRATQAGHSHAAVAAACLALNGGLASLAWAASIRPDLAGVAALVAAVALAAVYGLVERRCPMRRRPGSAP